MSDQGDTVGGALRERLQERGWSQADLAQVIGKTAAAVSEIIHGKRSVSPEIAVLLAAAFDTSPEFWLKLDGSARVSDESVSDAKRRAHLFSMAPVREMIRRGWIKPTADLSQLENELKEFFRVDTLEVTPTLSVATRRSQPSLELSASQRVWCFRVRNIAADLLASPFSSARIDACEAELRSLRAHAPLIKRVSRTLSAYGIRFVIVQPLSDTKIDGAALWLDSDKPVIAMSLRMDRIDSFWFTLMHEFSHIRHEDSMSVDSNLTGEDAEFSVTKIPSERRADEESARSLLPQDKIESFIARISPMYSRDRIIQFAHRMQVHPGIIVGQLQHRGEVRFSSHRDLLVKIRQKATSTSVVDGWGNTLL